MEEWRIHFDIKFRELADITGIDIATLKRAENRAAGKDVKNETKGVDVSVLYALADAYGMTSIEPLRRKPDAEPTEVERFVSAPPEWREDFMRMIGRLPK